MRLAWFSPWPPQPSGIAGRSAALVRRLSEAGMAVDVFVDAGRRPIDPVGSTDAPVPGGVRLQSAHDFVWRMHRRQYDLVVYQLGNSRLHEYIWPYLFRWPGLAVLHDARLHHARGRALLAAGRTADYRAEFAFNHPAARPEAAELAVAGFDGPYYTLWPMTRAVVVASKMVAVHTRGGAIDLAAASPAAVVEYVTLGEGAEAMLDEADRRRARAAFGLADDHVAFGVFGGLTADKRLPQILAAFARTWRHTPSARLVLAGAPDPRVDVAGLAATLGIADVVHMAGVLGDEAFDRAIAAVDVSVNLRWPSAVETSGPWLRALAAGRPTIVIDLAHQRHVPALDPRDWRPRDASLDADPVTVGVDILDEDHSLALAMRRLATDAALRDRIGRAARRYWAAAHTEAHMASDYERLLPRAAALPDPRPVLPPHLRPDPVAHVEALLRPFPEIRCALP
jgi:glycosyltransferase involved in cell wall biosynthesis